MRGHRAAVGLHAGAGLRFGLALVFVVVAVHAEQLPVAAIGGVVVVVVVAVVHGQLTQIDVGESAGATAADPGVDLERAFAVALAAGVGVAAGIGDDAVELAGVLGAHGWSRSFGLHHRPWSRRFVRARLGYDSAGGRIGRNGVGNA